MRRSALAMTATAGQCPDSHRSVGAGLGIAILPASHQPAATGAPATLAIAAQDATRPVGLAPIEGRQLPALAEAFRRWLISSRPG